MNCCASMVKYALYLLNVVFVICGILLIILGSIMIGNISDVTSFNEVVNTETIPILIIILGCIIFVVSFFGCCGTIRENICCTTTYAVFMFILFALQVALVVWIFVKRSEFLKSMGDVVDKAWEQNDNANGYPMNGLQLTFRCCGKTGWEDYYNNNIKVPASCCGFTNVNEECPADIYSTRLGCRSEFINFWDANMDIIRWGGLGLAAVELFIVIISCCLISSMRGSRNS